MPKFLRIEFIMAEIPCAVQKIKFSRLIIGNKLRIHAIPESKYA